MRNVMFSLVTFFALTFAVTALSGCAATVSGSLTAEPAAEVGAKGCVLEHCFAVGSYAGEPSE